MCTTQKSVRKGYDLAWSDQFMGRSHSAKRARRSQLAAVALKVYECFSEVDEELDDVPVISAKFVLKTPATYRGSRREGFDRQNGRKAEKRAASRSARRQNKATCKSEFDTRLADNDADLDIHTENKEGYADIRVAANVASKCYGIERSRIFALYGEACDIHEVALDFYGDNARWFINKHTDGSISLTCEDSRGYGFVIEE